MLTGTEVTELNVAYNIIYDKGAIGFIKSLKKGSTKVKAVNLRGNNISDKGVNDLILELKGTKITKVVIDKRGIKPKTFKKLLKVLGDNRHVNEESYTSTIESSTIEQESSKDISHTGKREKRDINTTNETLPKEESTVPTMDGSSTTTTKSTASSAGNPTTDSATVWSNPQKTTTLKEELTTPKKNLTEKSEPIATGVVADSTTEKHTPKESNPNNHASSTMSIGEILGLISFALTTIGAVGGTVR